MPRKHLITDTADKDKGVIRIGWPGDIWLWIVQMKIKMSFGHCSGGAVRREFTGDPLHNRAACTQPCNVNTHSRAHCSPGARLCEQWGHGCVNNGARLCASARLCRGSPVSWGCTALFGNNIHPTAIWPTKCHVTRYKTNNTDSHPVQISF